MKAKEGVTDPLIEFSPPPRDPGEGVGGGVNPSPEVWEQGHRYK